MIERSFIYHWERGKNKEKIINSVFFSVFVSVVAWTGRCHFFVMEPG